jgi:orotate phosphoribosyltransferase
MTPDEILALFRQTRALLEGHFQLTSGLHSRTYFQCARVLQFPANAEKLCAQILENLGRPRVDAVVAPALGGIVVAQEVGRQLGVRTMFTERANGIMQLRRGFEMHPGERVLVCEDVITTGGSVREVVEIVGRSQAVVAGIGAVVDRSGGASQLPGLRAAVTMEVEAFPPDACPLCAAGVPVEKPGSRGNR